MASVIKFIAALMTVIIGLFLIGEYPLVAVVVTAVGIVGLFILYQR